jgi:hypothetical protein
LPKVLAVGVYPWLVTYTGDSRNNGNSKACGVENFNFHGISASAAS